jgi:hypothetical protein
MKKIFLFLCFLGKANETKEAKRASNSCRHTLQKRIKRIKEKRKKEKEKTRRKKTEKKPFFWRVPFFFAIFLSIFFFYFFFCCQKSTESETRLDYAHILNYMGVNDHRVFVFCDATAAPLPPASCRHF